MARRYSQRGSIRATDRFAQARTKDPRNYIGTQSAGRRHDYTSIATGTPTTLAPGNYFIHELLKFKRTFSGSVDDTPPSATASNNFQSQSVFNGSKVVNFGAKIKVQNKSNDPVFLDIYEVALSFYDAFIWNAFTATSCPVTFDSTGISPDTRGEVSAKAITATLIAENTIKNFKFLQHYIKKVGTLSLGAEDSATNNAELTVSRVPPKCRRSQTGMYWAYFIHNDSAKNNAATLNIQTHLENSFREIPSEDRLPFIE